MELMNKQVQVVRHERLRAYYDACYEECVVVVCGSLTHMSSALQCTALLSTA